ncbi:MAG: FxsB family cyclophane-forming radical SAM/SPASM peptide maturase [Trebonia sp.]
MTAEPSWPHRLLDVPRLRAAGQLPYPFRQYVVKVASRCNLACDYCYVYQMADRGWRAKPHLMSAAVVRATAERIAEHAEAHGIRHVKVTLHGGEPLLAGRRFITGFAEQVRGALPGWARAELGLQTNGTLLDESMLDALTADQVRVGVSIDGDRSASGHRRYPGGEESYEAVARALALLRTDRYRRSYAGLLTVVSLDADPGRTYAALLAHEPPMVDFLLPHGTWSVPPAGRHPDASTPYADWLLEVFRHWAATPAPRPRVRLFQSILSLLLGGPSETETLGLAPADIIVVDTDGAISQVDTLSVAYDGAAETGLNVLTDPFDAALDQPGVVARQLGAQALAARCIECTVRDVCGGGYYPHRFRAGDGFLNPSVYCPDLLRLITVIRDYLTGELDRLATRT